MVLIQLAFGGCSRPIAVQDLGFEICLLAQRGDDFSDVINDVYFS